MHAKRKSLVIVGMLTALLLSACGVNATAAPSAASELTPEALPTATLSPAAQVAEGANQWQKDLMEPSVAIGKLLLTFVVLVIVSGIVLLGLIGVFSPKTQRGLGERIRKALSSMRKGQIVIAEFDNATDKDDYLAKLVRALLAERIRALLLPDGLLGKLREAISAERNPFDVGEHSSARDKINTSLDDLKGNVAATEIKLISVIVRWLFPVPGTMIQGHLIKTGDTPQAHRLVVELVDLVSGTIRDTNEFRGDSVSGNPAYGPALAKRKENKKPAEESGAAIYEKMVEKAALWAGHHALIEELKISGAWRRLKKYGQAQTHNYIAYMFTENNMAREAIAEYLEAIDADKDKNGIGNWYVPYWNLGDEYSYNGQQDESITMYSLALKVIEKTKIGMEKIPNIRVASACSQWLRGAASDREDAMKIIKEAEQQKEMNAGSAYNLACFYALSGRHKDAFRWLDKAMNDNWYVSRVQEDPDMAALRKRPEYRRLLARHTAPANRKG